MLVKIERVLQILTLFYGIDAYKDTESGYYISTNVPNGKDAYMHAKRVLGEYKTEERTREVIKEIVEHYAKSKVDPECSVFYMP